MLVLRNCLAGCPLDTKVGSSYLISRESRNRTISTLGLVSSWHLLSV